MLLAYNEGLHVCKIHTLISLQAKHWDSSITIVVCLICKKGVNLISNIVFLYDLIIESNYCEIPVLLVCEWGDLKKSRNLLKWNFSFSLPYYYYLWVFSDNSNFYITNSMYIILQNLSIYFLKKLEKFYL